MAFTFEYIKYLTTYTCEKSQGSQDNFARNMLANKVWQHILERWFIDYIQWKANINTIKFNYINTIYTVPTHMVIATWQIHSYN